VFRLRTFQLPVIDRGLHRSGTRVADGVLSHHHAGRDFAAADAGGRNHAHLFSKGKILEKGLRTGQLARDGVADPHGESRRRRLALLPLRHGGVTSPPLTPRPPPDAYPPPT